MNILLFLEDIMIEKRHNGDYKRMAQRINLFQRLEASRKIIENFHVSYQTYNML